MDEKLRFVFEYERDEQTMGELCFRFGICRDTGYVWLRRYRQYGVKGLAELNRAAHRHPNQTAAELEQAVLELREAHMRWGPRKLKRILERDQPGRPWPATSTMGEIVRRAGLVVARKKRRRTEAYTQPLAHAKESNRVWCADFKGWFKAGDGARVDPLTISDAWSRYLLRCQAVEKTDTPRVQAIFEAAFREYGLPDAIRTDNGAPFASCAIAGLSQLALWWMKLGIVPERIQPSHPEQNGRHERMHLTLQQETMSPMAANRRAQQRRFDEFRSEYNEQRPHQALDMRTPASCYTSSPRSFPARVLPPEYGTAMLARRVNPRGQFSWKHDSVFVSKTLAGEWIGLEPMDDRWYTVYFAEFALARFDSRTRSLHRLPPLHTSTAREQGKRFPLPLQPHPLNPDPNLSTMSPV